MNFANTRTAVILLILFTLITGGLYPLLVTGIAGLLFPRQADGSLVRESNTLVGSALLGQPFTASRYFHGRPSAVTQNPGGLLNSAGSNLGPLDTAMQSTWRRRISELSAENPLNRSSIPVDLVTASASGLDPDVSIQGALFQVPRVARARGVPAAILEALIARQTSPRQLGFLGEPRVNVLELNIALDALLKAGVAQ